MMKLELLCFNNDKKVYSVEVSMRENDLIKQVQEGVLTYFNPKTGIEIINLRAFDKVVVKNQGMSDWKKFIKE